MSANKNIIKIVKVTVSAKNVTEHHAIQTHWRCTEKEITVGVGQFSVR